MKMLATVATQAVCVHLAARNAGSLLDKAKLKICIQLSGSTRQAFEKHAATLQSILRISPKVCEKKKRKRGLGGCERNRE